MCRRDCLGKKNKGKVPQRIQKAEREKLKREHLNDLFLDLASARGNFHSSHDISLPPTHFLFIKIHCQHVYSNQSYSLDFWSSVYKQQMFLCDDGSW